LIDPFTFILLALAAYRITRLLIQDEILAGPREALFNRLKPTSKITYFLNCYWCLGFWVSILVVLAYSLFPGVMIVVALVLAMSALVGIVDALLNR
jgi:hypothetical protein